MRSPALGGGDHRRRRPRLRRCLLLLLLLLCERPFSPEGLGRGTLSTSGGRSINHRFPSPRRCLGFPIAVCGSCRLPLSSDAAERRRPFILAGDSLQSLHASEALLPVADRRSSLAETLFIPGKDFLNSLCTSMRVLSVSEFPGSCCSRKFLTDLSRISNSSFTAGVSSLNRTTENFSRLHRNDSPAFRRSKSPGLCNRRTFTVAQPVSTLSGLSHEFLSGVVKPQLLQSPSTPPMKMSTAIIKPSDFVTSSVYFSGCLPDQSFRFPWFSLNEIFADGYCDERRRDRGHRAVIVSLHLGRTLFLLGLGPVYFSSVYGPVRPNPCVHDFSGKLVFGPASPLVSKSPFMDYLCSLLGLNF